MLCRSRLRKVLLALFLTACTTDPTTQITAVDDAGTLAASVAPILRAGVDPALFLPRLVAGYHPTAEELATSGKACTSDADCATTGGQVVFHCSTPYYGQAQCQGVFPPGDQVIPGEAPSCVYYECPAGYECEAEAESRSIACIESVSHRPDAPRRGR